MNKFLIKTGVISLVLLGSAGSFGMTKELLVARLDHKPLLLENAPFNFVGLPVEMQRRVLMHSNVSSFYTMSKTSTEMYEEVSLCEKEYSHNQLAEKKLALIELEKNRIIFGRIIQRWGNDYGYDWWYQEKKLIDSTIILHRGRHCYQLALMSYESSNYRGTNILLDSLNELSYPFPWLRYLKGTNYDLICSNLSYRDMESLSKTDCFMYEMIWSVRTSQECKRAFEARTRDEL